MESSLCACLLRSRTPTTRSVAIAACLIHPTIFVLPEILRAGQAVARQQRGGVADGLALPLSQLACIHEPSSQLAVSVPQEVQGRFGQVPRRGR